MIPHTSINADLVRHHQKELLREAHAARLVRPETQEPVREPARVSFLLAALARARTTFRPVLRPI